jgi:hypothetical protein
MKADWDFFSQGTGAKAGYIETLYPGHCVLRCSELIEHRRWIRLLVSTKGSNVCFTAVGRIVQREDKMEGRADELVTLYRYGVEFVYAPNPAVATPRQYETVELVSA